MRLFRNHIVLISAVLGTTVVLGQIPGGLVPGVGDGKAPTDAAAGSKLPVQAPIGGDGSPIGGDLIGSVNDLLKGLGLANLDLDSLLRIDWKNDKEVLNLGGEKGKAKIELLAKQKGKANATDEEKAALVKEEYAKTPQGKAVLKAKEDEENGRLNFFYCYGMQTVGDIVKTKWVLMFDNAMTAIRYFKQVKGTYAEYYQRNRHKCKEDPVPQIFIFPHGVGPDQLEKTKEFTNFTGKVFVNHVDEKGQLPVIPHQDVFGYLPSRWSPS